MLLVPLITSAQEIRNQEVINDDPEIPVVSRFVSAFYFEAAGNGISCSFNLEEKFYNRATLRVGVGGFGQVNIYSRENSNSTYNTYVWKPVVVVSSSYLIFGPEKFLELGFGITIQPQTSRGFTPYIPDNNEAILPAMTIGYRYQPIESGFMFRVCFTPFIANDLSIVTPYGGISAGHTF